MEIIAGIVEAIVGIIMAVVEAIVGLFVAGAEALTAWEAVGLLFVLLVELAFWFLLFVAELVVALCLWRKPKRVSKPVLWRPKKLIKESKVETNA